MVSKLLYSKSFTMKLNYSFKNNVSESADGSVSLHLEGKQFPKDACATLYWAQDANNEISPLPEYTPIVTLSVSELAEGYRIDKELRIPKGATHLLAEIAGGEATERASFKIPEGKLTNDRQKPIYTVGFASDFHIGGWGSEKEPKEGLIKAREGFNRLVDFLVTEGDLVQWHGCYSGEEFIKYNYSSDAKKWGDNGERDPKYIEIGRSQWEMLESYLSGFTIPVYHCQGNHDIIDEDHWSPMAGKRDYFGEFLTKWIKKSEESGLYEHRVERDESVHYYEAIIKGHKFVFTEAPHPYPPHKTVGKTELSWLDRRLFDGEESGKPIFVLGHSPIDQRLNKKTAYADFSDLDELRAVLEKHPTVIYVSGHSHFTLDTPLSNAIDGAQETPSHLHNGGMTTTIDPPPMTQYNVTHGTVAEVYADKILIRGRNFTTGEWISLAESALTFKKPCLSGNIGIKRGEGRDLSALAEKSDGIIFEWYLNGEHLANGESITLPEGACGYIALRAKDHLGGFKSTVYLI